MKSAKANQVQFVFLCGSLKVETFHVVEFAGVDKISDCYDYTITLRSPDPDIKSEDILNKPASLFIFRDDEFYPYSGIVSKFSYVETSTDFSTYVVHLVPHLWLAGLNIQSRVFQKMKVDAIVKKVLDDNGLSDYYTFDLQGSYPEREFVVQHKETDLNFIQRLLEEAGIWYFFKELPILKEELESVGKDKLIISDKPDSFVNISGDNEIVYRSKSGMVQSNAAVDKEYCSRLNIQRNVVTKSTFVKNYNYRTPEVALNGQKPIEGGMVGKDYQYGGKFRDTDNAQKEAALLARQHSQEVSDITGSSDCRGFRAGMRFKLNEHSRNECNDTYLILSVTHSAAHTSASGFDKQATYINHFQLVASKMITFFAPQHSHKATPVNGIITAPIEANGSDYASLDDQGRYKVRMPFDISDNKNYDASKYVRLAQPYSGPSYGIHFPSHEGAEMILACIDGDIDKPLGIGTVPNANTISPVVSANKEQSVIRTAGKNEMVFDDTKDKQKIHVTTAAKNVMTFDDENDLISVVTTYGSKMLIDDKNKTTTLTADKHNIMMAYNDSPCIVVTSGEGHVIKIDDKAKKLTIQTKAGHVIQLDDDGGTMVLTDCKGKNTVTLDGAKGLSLESKGKIVIKAAEDLEISGANIKMEAAKGKVDMKAKSDFSIAGVNVNVKANSAFKAKGTNVDLSADAKMAIKGSVSAEMSGVKVAVKGSAMTEVTGALVKIN